MFNPAKAAEEIKKEYIGYIGTTFHFKEPALQQRLMSELEKTVSNGPFVEIKDIFRSGKSVKNLIDEGLLSPLFNDLEKEKPNNYKKHWLLERELYLHQEEALRRIIGGHNVVVSTGTGSGKTDCFLLPVINELLREKEKGTLNDGVRAMFIYPMNALANDQIKGLREILMQYSDITFGVYNGGTEYGEDSARKLYESMFVNAKYPELRKPLPNERLSREKMKKRPPHILFTNYSMLEHMLFRPGDDAIFSNSKFKFVVLDEGHIYAGATGIETSFLIGRLKARVNSSPQFIITSATLGNGSTKSNKQAAEFAHNLTGCDFTTEDIISASYRKVKSPTSLKKYPKQFYVDLSKSITDKKIFFDDTIKKYDIEYGNNLTNEAEIIYDILTKSDKYYQMRELASPVSFEYFKDRLGFDRETAVNFVALCAVARKDGKALVDIRYHYFLRALDGCYLALDHAESLSLLRKGEYGVAPIKDRMFEIGVCDDCGEIAIIGKTKSSQLQRSSGYYDESEYYQIKNNAMIDDEGEEDVDKERNTTQRQKKPKNSSEEYMLCKSCGVIVEIEDAQKDWCNCDEPNSVKLVKLKGPKCKVCSGEIRRFNLGFDAATGVISTSLYEHIPEYSFKEEESVIPEANNIFLKVAEKKKAQKRTGSQFLIFSDSRQGAAKFACFLSDYYKEFLRRRGIWNVVDSESSTYADGIQFSDLVKLLENYFSEKKLFRESNDPNAGSSSVENHRNAWIALLNELHNSGRRTSLVSLGKLQFDYSGNSNDICEAVSDKYKLTLSDAKALLDYLVFDIVKKGALVTDKDTDINDEDRKYLYFSQIQKSIIRYKDDDLKSASPWLPTPRPKKDGTKGYYRNNKLTKTMSVLKVGEQEAIEFLNSYFDYLISQEGNKYSLVTNDGQQYYLPAKHFVVKIGSNAMLWKCNKCREITQFNIAGSCINENCDGNLVRLNSDEYCNENYYAMLYKNARITPLFVKEHTAQLAKKEALEYQQQFIRKEINALSCSTTFEMGVDVGDLETVFLRNMPPLPSNYAQRVGRAGRSIDAAAFALTFAKLSSHDFTFFAEPQEMINGTIYPPQFKLENEKIIKRHIYAVALSLYLHDNPNLYDGNRATEFINNKGYEGFFKWLDSKPDQLLKMLKDSFPNKQIQELMGIETFKWVDGLCGDNGILRNLISEFENDVKYLQEEYDRAMKNMQEDIAHLFKRKLARYNNNELIDILARWNILPKYGFPIDSVELSQNISSRDFKSLNLSRDLALAISEYAPSSEIVADGYLYTSRYIKKPFVNHKKFDNFDISYIADCPECDNVNYQKLPVGQNSVDCTICGAALRAFNFRKSIEPRAGFIAEKDAQTVPLKSQERKYRTEAIYIGDKDDPAKKHEYELGKVHVEVESTTNDSLVVKSTSSFYVCLKCGYSIADDEGAKLKNYADYEWNVSSIRKGNRKDVEHDTPFGKGKCNCIELERHLLHHEFSTDVAKIGFNCDTEDVEMMLSVMYALLNSFAKTLNIERRDINACLTSKKTNVWSHKIIIYDAVPGGAGHSRRLVTEDGDILRRVVKNAYDSMNSCSCNPSCYRCLRSYENQKIHEQLDRLKALSFLQKLVG